MLKKSKESRRHWTKRLFLRGLRLSDAESYEKNFAHWEIVQYLRHTCPWPYPIDY